MFSLPIMYESAKEKLQQPYSNVLSWILTELQEDHADYISIVCKVNYKNLVFKITNRMVNKE